MLAVDTNVVVRFLTDDDPAQAAIARQLITGQRILLPDTVLLETEWVLRSLYGYSSNRIHHGLNLFSGLPSVQFARPLQVALALGWYAQGMDFADALHLAAAMQNECDALATFDRKLAAAARKAGAGQVKLL